jgi:hypothetical protein
MASPNIPDGEEALFKHNMYWMNQDWLKNQENYITALEKPAILFFLLPPHFCDSFSNGKERLWSGSKGVTCKKHRLSHFGLRIWDCGFFGFLFQSAFRNRHSAIWRRAYRVLPNSECGMWNSEFLLLFFHSALCIPHFNCPPGPRNEGCLMVFARNALAPGPGNAWNSTHLPPIWRKLKGQVFFSFFLNPTSSCDKNL